MSAIAFYDSGRLLPYRHDLKQKQIEQRNIDAENTRKYIGYAGGAFANMAERTGTIFGARLGKAPTTTDATGKTVDAAMPYGGGTTGAEYAKADWQKGVMDDENHRRKVTHKLGLLTESVKYASIIRKREAWGDFDNVAGEKNYEKRWASYLADVTARAMSKTELMRTYKDLFSEDDYNIMETANLQPEGTEKDKLLNNLDRLTPFSRWITYATENKYYDPTVAGKSQPEVDLLMAFLRDEVRFPGMNKVLADREAQKKESEVVDFKEGKDGESEIHTKFQEKFGDGEEVIETKGDSGIKKSMLEKQDLTWSGMANKLLNLPENLVKAEKQEQQNIIAQQKKLGREAKRSSTLKEREQGLGGDYVGRGDIIKPTVPEPVDWNVLHPLDSKEANLITKNLGNSSFEKVFTNLPTVDENGRVLRPDERAMILHDRIISTLKIKLSNNLSILGETEPTDFKLYGGVKKVITEAEKKSAADIIKDNIKKFENLEHLKLRMSGEDGGEWDVAKNKIKAWARASLAFVETKLLDVPPAYKDLTKFDFIDAMVKREREGRKARDGISLTENKLFGNNIKPEVLVKPETNIQASMIIKPTTFKIDPGALTKEEHHAQAIKFIIKHEDPGLSGRVIDDNKRVILGGSVDAWGIVGGDIESARNVIMDVLKIKDSAKIRAFLQYFNTKDLDEHLGHIKKGKPALTDLQMKRRKLLELTSEQTEALVTWAYDKNLNTLTTSHGFLDQEVYRNNPSLHQLLGDMAYRHGGSYMTRTKAGYKGLANAIDHALNPTKDYSRADAITDMNRLLFKQGTYSKKKEQGNARYAFLQDRFNRFKQNTAGVNVATTDSSSSAYKSMTVAGRKSKLRKDFKPLLSDIQYGIKPLPKFTLTGYK